MTENQDGQRRTGKLKAVSCKEKIRTVSCCDKTVLLLSEDGKVLFMDTGYTPRPLEIPSKRQVSQVACGHKHSLVITQAVCMHGNNEPGSSSPRRIESLSRLPLAQITAGGDHSFVWLNGQTVIGWGKNTSGQLGLGDTTDRNVPTQVLFIDMKKTVFIACGKDHTVILTKDGTVFTFGCGQYGQLGHNSLMDDLQPRVVEELLGTKVTQIACGGHHTLVFSGSSKNIYSFGNGEQGQLGNGANMNQSVPSPVQLTRDHSDFKKLLVVNFDEDPKLSHVYRRDFLLHLFKELMSPDSNMFMYNDTKTLAWFPYKPKLAEDRYFQLGILCGLALYNHNIVNLSFPLALFKKLLNIEVTLEDLRDFSPVLGESLRYILEDYTYDDIDKNLIVDFLISWDGIDVELDPHNPGKLVTHENKKEFVDLYVNYIFNKSVERVFEKFQQGFFKVCDQDVVQLFQPEELRGLMVGKENYDWGKLKQNTSYEGIYHVSHPNIVTFWKVFDELTEDQKKAFILFLTGCDRVPILGMDHIRMRVRDLYNSSQQHFPEALTCHSILELPQYSSKDTLQARLTEAISNNRGFSQE
ncbi:E3 ISG15--protein ligase HERC5-like [Aplochiton taeniatus]